MSKGKIGAIVVSVVLVFYFVLMGHRAWILVREPDLVPRLMGIALFVLPLIGAWTLVVELMFGAQTEKLARILKSEGGLPVDDLRSSDSSPSSCVGGAMYPEEPVRCLTLSNVGVARRSGTDADGK